jgi:hypothetical protein
MMDPEWRTVTEVAAEMGWSVAWVRRLCAQGRMPGARKIGRVWVIPWPLPAAWREAARPEAAPVVEVMRHGRD